MPNTSSQHDTLPYGAVALVALTVVLAGAKLSGLLTVGWVWVFAPVWGLLVLFAVAFVAVVLVLWMEKMEEGEPER